MKNDWACRDRPWHDTKRCHIISLLFHRLCGKCGGGRQDPSRHDKTRHDMKQVLSVRDARETVWKIFHR